MKCSLPPTMPEDKHSLSFDLPIPPKNQPDKPFFVFLNKLIFRNEKWIIDTCRHRGLVDFNTWLYWGCVVPFKGSFTDS